MTSAMEDVHAIFGARTIQVFQNLRVTLQHQVL